MYAFKGWVDDIVDGDHHVAGGCRALTEDGLHWRCYLGEEAVKQGIISQDFSDRVHLSGQQVQQVWQEIDKIDGIQERQVILCVDAINENSEPTELLRQLDELVQKPWSWLKIVLSSRPETWRSIKRGVNLAEKFYYREQGADCHDWPSGPGPVTCRQASCKSLPKISTITAPLICWWRDRRKRIYFSVFTSIGVLGSTRCW